MKTIYAAFLVILLGCQAPNAVVTTTQTVLGVSVSENPSTQLYEARLGFARNEFAYVPHTSFSPLPGETNAAPTPNVIMEIRVNNILSGGMIYQRLAVGDKAVGQPGASLMFSKDANGTVNSNIIDLITEKIGRIPTK